MQKSTEKLGRNSEKRWSSK